MPGLSADRGRPDQQLRQRPQRVGGGHRGDRGRSGPARDGAGGQRLCHGAEVAALEASGIEALVATAAEGRRRRHDFRPTKAGTAVKDAKADWLREMANKLESEEGRALYRLRQQTVEPVFGVIKAVLSASPASRCAASTRWPASGTWWRWPTTASACTSSRCLRRHDGGSGSTSRCGWVDTAPPVQKIDGPAIAPNPSSPPRPTSIMPPADDSQIAHNRNPTPKSDRLLARTSQTLERSGDCRRFLRPGRGRPGCARVAGSRRVAAPALWRVDCPVLCLCCCRDGFG